MSKKSTIVKRDLKNSIGAGVSAVLSRGKTFYVLEHRSTTGNFVAGEKIEVIVDYAELGRDKSCLIQFGDDQATVSRVHAAIQKEGNEWLLYQLSTTNPTLLNGRPVQNKWYLQSGDEIQLSVEGPILGFIVPSNNKTGSIGLSRRLSLFRNQALRPYKNSIIILGILLLIAISAGAFTVFNLSEKSKVLTTQVIAGQVMQDSLREIIVSQSESHNEVVQELRNSLAEADQKRLRSERALQDRLEAVTEDFERQLEQLAQTPDHYNLLAGSEELLNDVFHIRVDDVILTLGDGTKKELPGWSCSGFLTTDKKFVTARHCVETWYYLKEEEDPYFFANLALNNSNATIQYEMTAQSSGGKRFKFSHSDFNVDRTLDTDYSVPGINGQSLRLSSALEAPSSDHAYARVNQSGAITLGYTQSVGMPRGTNLLVAGFPFNLGASDPGNIQPITTNIMVTQNGLESGIITSTVSFDQGNSGGPVFTKQSGKFFAVGIVSGIIGSNVGLIVPVKLIEY